MQLVRPTLADDGVYRPGLHPEHPAAVEGCRPVSRGLMLELVTIANVIDGCISCRLANEMQIIDSQIKLWWRVKDLNLRRQSRGIYSPLPLAARATRQGRTSSAAIMDSARGKDTLGRYTHKMRF